MCPVTEESEPTRQGEDGLLLATRLLAAVIIPVLVAAFTILSGIPGSTPRLWAWTIRPDLASLVMGGAYVAGAWFFARGLYVGRWHRVVVGWLAAIPFTTLLGMATVSRKPTPVSNLHLAMPLRALMSSCGGALMATATG